MARCLHRSGHFCGKKLLKIGAEKALLFSYSYVIVVVRFECCVYACKGAYNYAEQQICTPPPLQHVVAVLLLTLVLASGLQAQGSIRTAIPTPAFSANVQYSPNTGAICPSHHNYAFSDVVEEDYFCYSLQGMAPGFIVGYTGVACTNAGYSSPCFLPKRMVTRAEFAVMLLNAFTWVRTTPATPTFSDVGSSYWAYTAIETAYSYGVITGFPDGTFRPDRLITRGQMAKMVAVAAGFNDNVSIRNPLYDFTDVDSGYYAYAYIERLAMNGVTKQYPPTTYAPQPNPPPAPEPDCTRGFPCFFGERTTLRADAMMFIAGVKLDMGYAQVFSSVGGDNWNRYEGNSGYYSGVRARMTTPDPPQANQEVKVAPVGLNNNPNGIFIESGPMKQCDPFCNIHPYGSWGNWTSEPQQFWDTSINLLGNGEYEYRSYHYAMSNTWQAEFLDGNGWHQMIQTTVASLGYDLPYATVGVETYRQYGRDYRDIHGIATTVSLAQFYKDRQWQYFNCYDTTLTPWRSKNGVITQCNGGSWVVSYP